MGISKFILSANPTLHIPLNPEPEERLSNAEYYAIAHEYIESMGYGDQPYIIYKQENIDRHHIHIASVCVDETGYKIHDSYEHKRSTVNGGIRVG